MRPNEELRYRSPDFNATLEAKRREIVQRQLYCKSPKFKEATKLISHIPTVTELKLDKERRP